MNTVEKELGVEKVDGVERNHGPRDHAAAPPRIANGVTRFVEGFDWESVPVLNYKETGDTFKSITRRVLFQGAEKLPTQWRYFEIAPGGHSTLERHDHLHEVMILRGRGKALVGREIYDLNPFDIVHIDSMTWHQFRATAGEPFGFLCLVNIERDKPQLPNDATIKELRANADVAAFIRV